MLSSRTHLPDNPDRHGFEPADDPDDPNGPNDMLFTVAVSYFLLGLLLGFIIGAIVLQAV